MIPGVDRHLNQFEAPNRCWAEIIQLIVSIFGNDDDDDENQFDGPSISSGLTNRFDRESDSWENGRRIQLDNSWAMATGPASTDRTLTQVYEHDGSGVNGFWVTMELHYVYDDVSPGSEVRDNHTVTVQLGAYGVTLDVGSEGPVDSQVLVADGGYARVAVSDLIFGPTSSTSYMKTYQIEMWVPGKTTSDTDGIQSGLDVALTIVPNFHPITIDSLPSTT